jgi:phospholipase/carboxylesterase
VDHEPFAAVLTKGLALGELEQSPEGIGELVVEQRDRDHPSPEVYVDRDVDEIDQDHLIGVGYSNGANILTNLLFQNPSLLAAAVLMHPLIPFTPEDQPGLAGRRVLITAGERDPICPPAMTRALYGYFERQGTAAQLVFHPGGHELQESELGAVRKFVAPFRPL